MSGPRTLARRALRRAQEAQRSASKPGEPTSPVEIPLPDGAPAGARAYAYGQMRILVLSTQGSWHMSIYAQDRYPTWEEAVAARQALLPPDVVLVVVMQPDGTTGKAGNALHFQQALGRPTREQGGVLLP